MATLDRDMLAKARASIKQAFVPMPGGQSEPVAGASQLTAAIPGAPQDPAAAGGAPVDPNTGMPMDPAMAGGMPPGAPVDLAMAGGMPPGAPVDPAMAGGDPAAAGMPPMDPAMMEQMMAGGGMPPADGNITMPVSQLLQLIQTLLGQAIGGSDAPGKPAEGGEAKPKKAGTSSKIDAIYQALSQQGIIAPESGAAPAGGAPAGAPQG